MAIIKGKGGLAGGATFITLVVGLLLYLHLGGKVEVPRTVEPLAGTKKVYVCEGAPDWVYAELPDAMEFWRSHGVSYGAVIEDAQCPPACSIGERLVPCREGGITIDLRDQPYVDDHADETLRKSVDGKLKWATILLPRGILPSEEADAPTLSKDVDALVLAHALGHAEGFEHSVTRITRGKNAGAVAHKTGELMHPKLHHLGWGTAGLP